MGVAEWIFVISTGSMLVVALSILIHGLWSGRHRK